MKIFKEEDNYSSNLSFKIKNMVLSIVLKTYVKFLYYSEKSLLSERVHLHSLIISLHFACSPSCNFSRICYSSLLTPWAAGHGIKNVVLLSCI